MQWVIILGALGREHSTLCLLLAFKIKFWNGCGYIYGTFKQALT